MMMTYSIPDLLPHEPPMVLLDHIEDYGSDYVVTKVLIEKAKPFFIEDHGVPSYVGIEYMAQTCGVLAGLQSKEHGSPISLGFLLGTRNFHVKKPWFKLGESLSVHVKEVFRQEQMGVFDCCIKEGSESVVTAQLNLYQSDEKTKKEIDNE